MGIWQGRCAAYLFPWAQHISRKVTSAPSEAPFLNCSWAEAQAKLCSAKTSAWAWVPFRHFALHCSFA